jgi:hypothetical protein
MARRAEDRWADAEPHALLKRRRASMRRQQRSLFHNRQSERTARAFKSFR